MTPHRSRGIGLLAIAALGVLAVLPSTAAATPTPAELTAQGWDCAPTPPFVSPQRIVCGTPGTGRPFPGNPAPRPTYKLKLFALSGEFLAHVHFVRADLYAGQPCLGGASYVSRSAIGYYECINPFGPND